VLVKYRVPVGLPTGGKKYPSRTHLDSGRVQVPPAGKKSCLYPSGRVPDGYRVPIPELPSLLREDDSAAGPGMAWAIGNVGSGMVWGVQHRGISKDDVVACSRMTSRAWGQGLHGQRHQWLGSGKMAARKGLHHGRERRCGGSGEDSMMTQAPRRLMTAWDPGKFLTRNFGNLTA
jgi:hypothetical protein